MFQVQRDAQLVAKAVEGGDGNIVGMLARKRASFGAEVGRVGAAGVASADGVLNLDDFGPEAGEEQRCEGTGKRSGEIEDRDVFKGLHGWAESGVRFENNKDRG